MTFEQKHSKAIELIHQNVLEDADKNKPLIPHLLRVGKYLYDNNYSEIVINAGLLHDVLEWTHTTKETLLENFGQEVLDIVIANTKNRNIEDPEERRKDYVKRCKDVSAQALIVKSADVLDSFLHYTKQGNKKEKERSKHIARLILQHTDTHADPIFEKLKEIAA